MVRSEMVCGCEGLHRSLEEVQLVSAWQPRSLWLALFKALWGRGAETASGVTSEPPHGHDCSISSPAFLVLPLELGCGAGK